MSVQPLSTITFTPSCLPISKAFHRCLNQVLNLYPEKRGSNSITINFRNKRYSAENGGYHPVEVAFTKVTKDHYSILYITDFSYSGYPYPELERDIDFDIGNSVVFTRYSGWKSITSSNIARLYQLWERNFIAYLGMGTYDHIEVRNH